MIRSHFFWALFLAFIAASGGLLTIREPLWIDELHTFWTVDAPLSQVAERARAGNQSPVWFWIQSVVLKVADATRLTQFLSATVVLRLLPLSAWVATIFLCGWAFCKAIDPRGENLKGCAAASIGTAVLLVVDQINWFYAIEARPYSAVALAVAGAAVLSLPGIALRPWLYHSGFVAFGVLAIYLHYTAVVVVCALVFVRAIATQMAAGPESGKLRSTRKSNLVELGCLSLFSLPAMLELSRIGDGRGIWSAFAAHTSFLDLLRVSPLVCWIGILVIGLIIERGVNRLSGNSNLKSRECQQNCISGSLVLTAALAVLSIYFVTAFGIAPLMHSRYLIGTYPLTIVSAGLLISRYRSRTMLAVVVALTLLAWTAVQGRVSALARGQLISWQRHEDWPGMLDVVLKEFSPDKAYVVYAPMLVETRDEDTIKRHTQDYLKFPIQAACSLKQRETSDEEWQTRISQFREAVERSDVLTNDINTTLETLSEVISRASPPIEEILFISRSQPYIYDIEAMELQLNLGSTARDRQYKIDRIYGVGRLTVYRFSRNSSEHSP